MLQAVHERSPQHLPHAVPDASLPPLGTSLNVLMVWPKFPPSFWGFEGVLDMLPEAAMTPPLGLITVAALCPPSWTIRLIDHCFRRGARRRISSGRTSSWSAPCTRRGSTP